MFNAATRQLSAIFFIAKLMQQEALDRLRELIDSSPRCRCGGNCELLQSLAEQVLDIQENELGFQAQCPTCNQPLQFNPESIHGRYSCKQCKKSYRYHPSTGPIETLSEPRAFFESNSNNLDAHSLQRFK
ncbi:MAG: hypothetical protein ABSF82_08215 [Candidatus Bathyarchaeia archaeon]